MASLQLRYALVNLAHINNRGNVGIILLLPHSENGMNLGSPSESGPIYFEHENIREVIDTSLLLDELRHSFQQTGQQVEVDFRKLVDWVRLGDQQTHQIHPYPAKLLPNIAHFFVRASTLTKRACPILDPFCGSGTVALEASLAGFTPYVADANPFALLLTNVKTHPYAPIELHRLTNNIVARASRLKTAPQINIINHHLWYSDDRKRNLEILLHSINEIENEAYKNFFLICFSNIARKFSYADPAISVPVRLKTKKNFSPKTNEKIRQRLTWIQNACHLTEFTKVCSANINRILETNNTYSGRHKAVEVGNDARNLKSPYTNTNKEHLLENDSIPIIISSPPYGSAQKYVRATSLSLNWLGLAAPNDLAYLEGCSIGREHVPQYREHDIHEQLPAPYESLIERIGKRNATRALITRIYLQEMKSAVREMARVVSKGGHIVLIVGNNQVCGEPLRNDLYITQTLQSLGLDLEISLIDHIKSRGLMTKRNKTASIISRECVLVFKKK